MSLKFLYDKSKMIEIFEDLSKSIDHSLAFERVGFLICKIDKEQSILLHIYLPIPDESYIPNKEGFGAFYGKDIMDKVYSYLYQDEYVIYDIHVHKHWGPTSPSKADLWSEGRLVPSLARLRPLPHGSIILSYDSALVRTFCTQTKEMLTENLPLDFLKEHNLLKDRNSRQSFLSKELNNVLRSKKIGVIGLGGGGSQMVQSLAHLGFQNYVLCDFDKIELSNLSRLVGATMNDVENNELKVNIAKRLISGINRNAEIVTIIDMWQVGATKQLFNQCDLIIGCLDTFEQRRQLEIYCRKNGIPYLDLGMDVKTVASVPHVFGQVVLSLPNDHCMHCFDFFDREAIKAEDGLYDSPESFQVIFCNSALAAEATSILMNYFTSWKNEIQESCFFEYYSNKNRWKLRPPNRGKCDHHDE